MALPLFPEMTFRNVAVFPPMTVPKARTSMPMRFGKAICPVLSVPMKLSGHKLYKRQGPGM